MRLSAATGLAIVRLGGCLPAFEDPLPEDAEDGFVVDDGKADDFYSLKAKEFVVTGHRPA